MKKIVFSQKLRRVFPRLLAVFCAFAVSLGICVTFYPISKNRGISARADTMLPSTENLSTVSDLYSYDYMRVYVVSTDSPKSFVFGSPNYFYDPNSTVDYRDGFTFGQGSNTQFTLTRQYTVNSQSRLTSRQMILENGGSFSFDGSQSAKLTTVTAPIPLGTSPGLGCEIFYESVVIPASWIGYASTPTIQFILSSSNVAAKNSYFIAALVTCEIYSELGLQATFDDYSVAIPQGGTGDFDFKIFPQEIFKDLEGELFWIKNYSISLIGSPYFLDTTTLAERFQIRYLSWVSYPEYSFTDNSLSYIEKARFIDVSSNPIQRDYLDWLVTAVGGFMDAEIFPGFAISGILGIIVAIRMMLWLLKALAGG